jgi:carbonic anhydrase/acetyltransferase-like protein (isoleucine patch superfamily)
MGAAVVDGAVVVAGTIVVAGASVGSAMSPPSPLVSAVEQPTSATTPKTTPHPMRAVRRSADTTVRDGIPTKIGNTVYFVGIPAVFRNFKCLPRVEGRQ